MQAAPIVTTTPNPTTLYTVTIFVIAALASWLIFVLKNAKEPWAKEGLPVKDSVPSPYSTLIDGETTEGAGNVSKAPNVEPTPSVEKKSESDEG